MNRRKMTYSNYGLHSNTDLKYFRVIDSLILKEQAAIYKYNDFKVENNK